MRTEKIFELVEGKKFAELAEQISNDSTVFNQIESKQDETLLHFYAKCTLDKESNPQDIFAKVCNAASYEIIIAQQYEGKTALHFALEANNKVMVLKLLEAIKEKKEITDKRKPLMIKDDNGVTALELALRYNDQGVNDGLLNLIKDDCLSTRFENGATLLHLAIYHKNKVMVLKLLEAIKEKKEITDKRKPLMIKDDNGVTALELALRYNDQGVNDGLLNLIKDDCLSIRFENGATPLHLAIHFKNTNMALAMINTVEDRQKCDIPKDGRECSALYVAVIQEESSVVESLLNKFNCTEVLKEKDSNGNNLLQIALIKNNSEIALKIITKMSPQQFFTPNRENKSAFDYVKDKDMWSVYDEMLKSIPEGQHEQDIIKTCNDKRKTYEDELESTRPREAKEENAGECGHTQTDSNHGTKLELMGVGAPAATSQASDDDSESIEYYAKPAATSQESESESESDSDLASDLEFKFRLALFLLCLFIFMSFLAIITAGKNFLRFIESSALDALHIFVLVMISLSFVSAGYMIYLSSIDVPDPAKLKQEVRTPEQEVRTPKQEVRTPEQ